MTGLRETVGRAAGTLDQVGVANPRGDAVALAAHLLGVGLGEVERRIVLGHRLSQDETTRYDDLVARRAARIPLQHLTGVAHFRRLDLAVGPGVFVPRPESEVLVSLVLSHLGTLALHQSWRPIVVDLCTGSGAIALAIATEVPCTDVHAVELSPDAHAWAARNVRTYGGVELVLGDARTAFAELEGRVDVVTCNPPYIPADALPVDPEVADHDPELALYGGPTGLELPGRLAARAAELLRPGGLLVMEHADVQGEALVRMLRERGWSQVADHVDLTGRPRVVTAHS